MGRKYFRNRQKTGLQCGRLSEFIYGPVAVAAGRDFGPRFFEMVNRVIRALAGLNLEGTDEMEYQIIIAKADATLTVDWAAMPKPSRDGIIEYGLRQLLNDGHASIVIVTADNIDRLKETASRNGGKPDEITIDTPESLRTKMANALATSQKKLDKLLAGDYAFGAGGGGGRSDVDKECSSIVAGLALERKLDKKTIARAMTAAWRGVLAEMTIRKLEASPDTLAMSQDEKFAVIAKNEVAIIAKAEKTVAARKAASDDLTI